MEIIMRWSTSVMFVVLYLIYPQLIAQNFRISEDLKQKLVEAEGYLQAFQEDSVLLVTNNIIKEISASGQRDAPFGIQVQLIKATALERKDRVAEALPILLEIEEFSRKMKLWKLHTNIQLELALVYEKTTFPIQSRQHLDLAKFDIDRYGLDSLYPGYAVRISSWHRWFKDKDSSLFYAREVLRKAPQFGLLKEEADGHLMIAVILPNSEYVKRIAHSQKYIEIQRKMGNQKDLMIVFLGIAKFYKHAKDFSRALAYCDSAIANGPTYMIDGKIDDANVEILTPVGLLYELRGSIYQEMGLLDLALADVKQGYVLDLKLKEFKVQDKIREIDARYQTRIQEERIQEQRLALSLKNNQLRYSFIVVALVIVLAICLFVAYRKQQKIKLQLLGQNQLIQDQTFKLKALDSAKSKFFANVSHELRTPLTLILGPIDMLLSQMKLTGRQMNLLQLAHRNGKQLEQLVNDILDLGKLEMDKMVLHATPTPLESFFLNHFIQFESLAESRNIHYSYHLDLTDNIWVNLDQGKFRQILNNLLGNAFKFTPADGYITIKLSLKDAQLYLSIADTGKGIHSEDLPNIFDRYYQTNQADKPAEGGSGIGLALCYEYVMLMGGKIEAESIPEKGSVFRMTMPVHLVPSEKDSTTTQWEYNNILHPNTAPHVITNEIQRSLDRTGPTILVVEDNMDLQEYIRLILYPQYHVIAAENGKVALEILQNENKGPIQLIISDLMMPTMDGLQLLQQLKSKDATRHLPVIMLTARIDAQDKLRALRIGVDDYLIKPFEEGELLARIENLLTNQEMRRLFVLQQEQPDVALPLMRQVDQDWLRTFELYVQRHLSDPLLNIPELAEQFAMSESTLLRQLKRLTGLSPLQYVQDVRLQKARRLLEDRTFISIGQVAIHIGYEDVRSFSRSFKKKFGKLPSELS
jgi:signal transduction histidine kinase/DNA-binding response OmpR family regulator